MTMPACALKESPVTTLEARPNTEQLWKRYLKRRDKRTENALVEQYLPLVRSVLGRLALGLPDHADHDDLHSAGLVGLLQALRHYDPDCGTSFETYARLRVRGSMLDELRRMDWVPRTVHEKARRIQEAIAQLEQRYRRSPTEMEVASAMNLSLEAYNQLLSEIRPATFVCLDAVTTTEGGDSGSLAEVVADQSDDGPVEHTARNELKQIILRRLKELPDAQRKVLALYYGEDLRLREIAEVLGLTESRICQIHSQAILAIRAFIHHLERNTVGA
jgi:RNA polymerase sigma factor for flagellar operon FliA